MALDFNNLMQEVYDYFLDLYNKNAKSASGATFLAFEKMGHRLGPADFKVRADDAEYSPAMALESFSSYVNNIPEISADSVIDTSRDVDEFYGMLVDGAIIDGPEEALAGFGALKGQAREKFRVVAASLLNPTIQYKPAFATPRDWYDPSNEANWTHRSFRVGEPAPAPGPAVEPVSPVRPSPAVAVWKLNPTPQTLHTVLARDPAVAAMVRPAVFQALAQPAAVAAPAPAIAAATPLAQPMLARATVLHAQPMMAAHVAVRVMEPAAPVVQPPTAAGTLEELNPRLTLLNRAKVQRMVADSAPTQPVSSQQYSISFKYCMVSAERPWMFEPLLHHKSWRLPGFKSGEFSTGAAENNRGLFPALPLAFIAVKDLEITASWSSDDATAARDAVAVGPFSLVESTFKEGVLRSAGIQICAWICEVMPLLPPRDS